MPDGRRVLPLTPDTYGDIDPSARGCAFWQLGPAARVPAGGEDGAKGEWVRAVLHDWGHCGQVLYAGGAAVGHALYAPPHLLPGLAAFPVTPLSPDAVALAELRVVPGARGNGYGRQLVQATAADLARRGVRAVEAVAGADPPGGSGPAPGAQTGPGPAGRAGAGCCGGAGCLVPAGFLLATGFTVARPHPRTPRVRLDLRSTSWHETLAEAVRARLRRLRGIRGVVPEHASPRAGGA